MVQDIDIHYGLAGVNIDTSHIASIDGDRGQLIYRGYDISELEQASFEEVTYLLWNDDLPNAAQLADFQEHLRPHFAISDEIVSLLKLMPKDIHPMAALRTAVSALAASDDNVDDTSLDNVRDIAFRLTAKFPTITAAFQRIRNGLEPIAPREDLGIAANFLYMLTGEEPSDAAVRTMDVALVLHAEHGSNASTFVARATASSLTDAYSAITAAMGSLKGPLHGGANTAVMNTLESIGDISHVEQHVIDILNTPGGRVMGFGHRVYRVLDPRAVILRRVSERLAQESGESKWFDMSLEMVRVMDREMAKKGKPVKPNVDFFSASVYRMLGFPGDMYTPIFAVARISGWMAHLLEQYAENKLMRPRLVYQGPKGKSFTPVEAR